MKKITRIGIGGPVGSGKTAIVEAITPLLIDAGVRVLIITNDVVTTEDARHVQRTLKGILVEEKIIGVETGACPHTAVREDPSMNLAAVEEMEAKFPESDVVLIESGGDNLTLTFSPALVDFFIYVILNDSGNLILFIRNNRVFPQITNKQAAQNLFGRDAFQIRLRGNTG